MIVLDDPANFFSLIFSIRKIPNDLLDLERLNRPGGSVPSRESRTSTLKGLFLLEGPAAAPCILTADFRCWPQAEVCAGGRHVGFSNRPFQVKHFQTIRHCNVDVAHGLALLFGIGTRALPSWDSRTRWNNLSGGLVVSLNGRFKRTCELTSSIVPRGTSFHCWVDLGFSPIGFDSERFSCSCRG